MLFQICVFVEMVKLFEYKHFKIISHYCYHMNTSFALSYYKCMTHLYFYQWNSWTYFWWRH